MPEIQVYRGDKLESSHSFVAVLANINGLAKSWANSEHSLFTRSLIKPIQAKVSLDFIRNSGRDLSSEQIAIACASHNAELNQLNAVDGLLRDFNLDQSKIACGYKHNCSGKHSAILAACSSAALGLDYINPQHLYHQAMLSELQRLGMNRIPYSYSDGCGLQTYYLSVIELATIFQRMISDASYTQIIAAMNKYPLLIGGENQFDSQLMFNYPNQFIAKAGAEGLMMVGRLDSKEVLVLKLLDGARRAKAFAIAALMKELGWIAQDYSIATAEELSNAQGLKVGYLRRG